MVLAQLGDNPTPEQILGLKVCDPAMGSGAFLVEACRYLGEKLEKAWNAHRLMPPIPADQDPLLHARRIVAQRCLYGVDKNPFAVNLAKLSLWLATFAKDHPFTFVDHTLRCGDSLVGLTAHQVEAFHWQPKEEGALLRDMPSRLRHILNARAQILDAADETPYETLAQKLAVTEEQMIDLRLAGDLTIAAFFAVDKPKDRETQRKDLAEKFRRARERITDLELEDELQGAVRILKAGIKGVTPFHWELEFPEVFRLDEKGRRTGGFDGIVGNPPFAGKNTLVGGNAKGYLDWLKAVNEESHGNSDLVAHFFRRAFDLLRAQGCFGLIATNTIGQGDTRSTGLRWICEHGGTIFAATRRKTWPGNVSVVVSFVHLHKGQFTGACHLDGREVPRITAYLFHAGGHADPAKLLANSGKCFVGSYVLGMGFTFDDTDSKGVASPLSVMRELIAKDPRTASRIFPYIGGEEVNESPDHSHHRFVINFGEMTEEEARAWPELMTIVEEKVRPDRLNQGSIINPERWWMFARSASNLYATIRNLDRVLVQSAQAYVHLVPSFQPSNKVFAHSLAVFAFDTYKAGALLTSRTHELWARFFSGTALSLSRYNPSDCFETFPFPEAYATDSALEAIGRVYYEFRAELMIRNCEGLTKTYNRFHDPNEQSCEIKELRRLHDAIDREVLDAYGWADIHLSCDFFLDSEVELDSEEQESSRPRVKKYRYRWPAEIHDDVLARLLELNRSRSEEEAHSACAAPPAKTAGKRGRKATKGALVSNLSLFEVQEPTE